VSRLRQVAEDYLMMRRALGFSLESHGRLLMSFIGYLEQAGAASVTTDLAVAWARQTRPGASPARWSHRLAVVRIFARHLSALDPCTEIPAAELMPHHYRRVAPHLYSPEEIKDLIRAAAAIRHPLRALNYATLIALLAATGMRVGEACHLDRGDVDLNTGVLTLRVAEGDVVVAVQRLRGAGGEGAAGRLGGARPEFAGSGDQGQETGSAGMQAGGALAWRQPDPVGGGLVVLVLDGQAGRVHRARLRAARVGAQLDAEHPDRILVAVGGARRWVSGKSLWCCMSRVPVGSRSVPRSSRRTAGASFVSVRVERPTRVRCFCCPGASDRSSLPVMTMYRVLTRCRWYSVDVPRSMVAR
jgi:Phage integrase family